MGQSDYSTTYTSNVTLSTSGGTNAYTCKVSINGNEYDGIKAGTGSVAGVWKVTVPAGKKYLHLHLAGWNGESVTLSVTPNQYSNPNSISLTADAGISGTGSTYTLSGNPSTDYYKVITFRNALGQESALTQDIEFTFKASASGGKRFVVFGVNAEEESTYTITAESNNTAYGTVSLSGNTITATPNRGYRVSTTTPYEVTSGTASVSQNGNEFTVTPSSNCTVTINFEATPTCTVTYDCNGGTSGCPNDETVYAGESITLAAAPERTDYTFNGWSDGTNVYQAGVDYTVDNDVTFTAQWADPSAQTVYELFSGDLVEGDYVIYYNGYAMKNTVSSDRLDYETVTPSNDVIVNPDASIVWHIAPSGDYWTIYNAAENKYAAGTGAKNKAQLLADGTDDKALWTVSGNATYEFVNKQNAANGINANLRNNGTYGFACYARGTGGALTLYKAPSPSPITATFMQKYKGFTSIYYADKNLKVPANVTAHTYKVENGKGKYITNISPNGVIPAGTPVILEYANTLTEDVTVTFEEVASAQALNDGNMLRGSDAVDANGYTTGPEENVDYYFYVLSVGTGENANKIGFYWKLADGAAFQPTAHKVYLALKQDDVPANISMIDIYESDGINNIVKSNNTTQDVYSLSGVRMNNNNLPKGIYIVNGKKMIVK